MKYRTIFAAWRPLSVEGRTGSPRCLNLHKEVGSPRCRMRWMSVLRLIPGQFDYLSPQIIFVSTAPGWHLYGPKANLWNTPTAQVRRATWGNTPEHDTPYDNPQVTDGSPNTPFPSQQNSNTCSITQITHSQTPLAHPSLPPPSPTLS